MLAAGPASAGAAARIRRQVLIVIVVIAIYTLFGRRVKAEADGPGELGLADQRLRTHKPGAAVGAHRRIAFSRPGVPFSA